jgi:hypothetical protein
MGVTMLDLAATSYEKKITLMLTLAGVVVFKKSGGS